MMHSGGPGARRTQRCVSQLQHRCRAGGCCPRGGCGNVWVMAAFYRVPRQWIPTLVLLGVCGAIVGGVALIKALTSLGRGGGGWGDGDDTGGVGVGADVPLPLSVLARNWTAVAEHQLRLHLDADADADADATADANAEADAAAAVTSAADAVTDGSSDTALTAALNAALAAAPTARQVVVVGDSGLFPDRSDHERLLGLIASVRARGFDVLYAQRYGPLPTVSAEEVFAAAHFDRAAATAALRTPQSQSPARGRIRILPHALEHLPAADHASAADALELDRALCVVMLQSFQPARAFTDAEPDAAPGVVRAPELNAVSTAWHARIRAAAPAVPTVLLHSGMPRFGAAAVGALAPAGTELRALQWAAELTRADLLVVENSAQQRELLHAAVASAATHIPTVPLPVWPATPVVSATAAAASTAMPAATRTRTLLFVEESAEDVFGVVWFFTQIYPQLLLRTAPQEAAAAAAAAAAAGHTAASAAGGAAAAAAVTAPAFRCVFVSRRLRNEYASVVSYYREALDDGHRRILRVYDKHAAPHAAPHTAAAPAATSGSGAEGATAAAAPVDPAAHARARRDLIAKLLSTPGDVHVLVSLLLPSRARNSGGSGGGGRAPVRWSTVQALVHGIPVVTTAEAHSGLQHLSLPVAVSNSVDGVAGWLARAVNDPQTHAQLSAATRAAAATLLSNARYWHRCVDHLLLHALELRAKRVAAASAAAIAAAATVTAPPAPAGGSALVPGGGSVGLNILAVHITIPLGDQKGCDARFLQVLRAAHALGHRVTYLAFDRDSAETRAHMSALTAVVHDVVAPYDGRSSTLQALACRGYHMVLLFFWTTAKYWLFLDDVVSAFRTHAPRTRLVVLADEITFERQKSAALYAPTPDALAFEASFSARLQEPELAFFARADRVLTITDADAQTLVRAFGAAQSKPPSDRAPAAAPHDGDTNAGIADGAEQSHALHALGGLRSAGAVPGVGVLRLVSDASVANGGVGAGWRERRGLVFVSAQNGIASASLSWFLQRVLPLIRADLRGDTGATVDATATADADADAVPLTVIGTLRDPLPRDLPDRNALLRGVTFTGFVASAEVTARLNGARVFVSPVLAGTGVNTKNLLALEHGVPLVTTAVGARGLALDACPLGGACARVAANGAARAFADAVVALYRDRHAWERAHDSALRHVRDAFGADVLRRDLRALTAWVVPDADADARVPLLQAECVRRQQLLEYTRRF